MAEMLHIGAGFFAALDNYVQAVSSAALEAHRAGTEELVDSLRETARSHPRWKNAADHLEAWTEDGEVRVGVRTPHMVSEAHAAEYGDGHHPPAPLLRHMPVAKHKAAEKMDSVLHHRLGIPRHA